MQWHHRRIVKTFFFPYEKKGSAYIKRHSSIEELKIKETWGNLEQETAVLSNAYVRLC